MKNNKLSCENNNYKILKQEMPSATLITRSFTISNITLHELRCYWNEMCVADLDLLQFKNNKTVKLFFNNKNNANS